METSPSRRFSSPEEEVQYLRQKVARQERGLLEQHAEVPEGAFEKFAEEEIQKYGESSPQSVLSKKHQMTGHELAAAVEQTGTASDQLEDIVALAESRGIRNALTVLEKVNNPYVTDEVHRELVQLIKAGREIADLKEGMPLWQVLHMTLFEITLPEARDNKDGALKELISSMEQFYAGMQSITNHQGKKQHFTLEVAVSDNSDDIIFYVAVPTSHIDLFEKQLLSLFPDAIITEQQNDYNIFTSGGTSLVSVAELNKYPLYPLRTYESFDHDPLSVLLNAFSKIEREGGGAAVQFVLLPQAETYTRTYQDIIEKIRNGVSAKKAIRTATIGGEFTESLKEIVFSGKKEEGRELHEDPDLELFLEKIDRPLIAANIRIAVSAKEEERAKQIMSEVESSFNQFEHTRGNRITFSRLSGGKKKQGLKAFSFREFVRSEALPLSTAELTGLIHFPSQGIESSPQFKQSRAKQAPAPMDLPNEGTLIGTNTYRGKKTDVYITAEDRLRHFYVVGQTGTGKTTLMKNMIIQDIVAGNGVCMIDPHGTDITDVLAAVPPEREKDVIYFDPSYQERVIGLNMLEYDPNFPEQKTFVVNELFSIFQKLYGAVPESMGPMFEQYFRNATMLVLEDPDSGSTLLDVSRVMADSAYRRKKLAKAKNPVVLQFWQDIATKAGGEAALENIVPYITSKFDVFTANDYMRPIIGQQQSSFNFREVMDDRKILLVNLSKGRLGEINSNLIGMIIVGKILMAALSRVDNAAGDFPPFYLHMDEFQNVTTDSIAAILAEARKYKLGLTIAHQYVAQLEEKISNAVFGNVGSLASFRVGPEDAEFLEKQFEPVFSAHDLMNVENRHAYVRILANGTPTKPFNIATNPPPEKDFEKVERLIKDSYRTYGSHRLKVEMAITARYQRF